MNIVIIGGGFAGRNAAAALGPVAVRHTVRLIDKNSYTRMTNALPDVAADTLPEKWTREDLRLCLPGNIWFDTTDVKKVVLDTKRIVGDNEEIPYDKLLLCCGSEAVTAPDSFSHLNTYVIDSIDAARRIRDAYANYLSTESHPHIVVIGGGYTGIELACFLVIRGRKRGITPRVTIVEMMDTLLPFMSDGEREYVYRHLDTLGIRVLLGTQAAPFENGVAIKGERIENPFICWSTGSRLALSVEGKHLEQIKDGRVVVDSRLRVKNYPDVFAAGDAAAILRHGRALRKAVAFSAQTGTRAGKNCLNVIGGDAPLRYHPYDYGWIIPLATDSVGRLFDGVPVRGRYGMFLHYMTTGIRNVGLGKKAGFASAAFRSLLS